MSEDVTSSSPPAQTPSDGAPQRLGEHRVDGPHALRSSASPSIVAALAPAAASQASVAASGVPSADSQSATVDVDQYVGQQIEANSAAESASGVGLLREERTLLQASQIAERLRTQFSEMDRREQRLNGQLALLDQERRSVRLWVSQFEEEAEERDARLHQQEADCTERLQQCAKLEHELEQQRQELIRSQGELAAQRTEQTAELEREQTLLQNRVRFQEEHLKKARHELESHQEEFRREQQQAVQDRQRTAESLRIQRVQAVRFRDLLDQREKSLVRERELIQKHRLASQDKNDADRERLLNERQAWDRDQETQQSELRRQQNMLKLHAENLEARRLRLDRLRAELEDTHRKTLEMRLSVEEAWAQLAQSTGPDVAKQRVDEAQAALAEHYKQSREDLIQHRQELERAQTQYQKQRDEFREERQALAEWVTERTAQLQQREQRAAESEQTLESREQAWQQKQQQWNQEKAEAEAVIRDLLKQISDQECAETTPADRAAKLED